MCSKDTDNILREIHAKLGNLSRHHIKEEFGTVIEAVLADYRKREDPVYDTIVVGAQPYEVNYKNRRHVFAYNGTGSSITLTTPDGFWSTTLTAKTWTNISYPQGTQLSSATAAQFVIKCTNEVIP